MRKTPERLDPLAVLRRVEKWMESLMGVFSGEDADLAHDVRDAVLALEAERRRFEVSLVEAGQAAHDAFHHHPRQTAPLWGGITPAEKKRWQAAAMAVATLVHTLADAVPCPRCGGDGDICGRCKTGASSCGCSVPPFSRCEVCGGRGEVAKP